VNCALRAAAPQTRDSHPIQFDLKEIVDVAEEKLFQAEYIGSGTFVISKPKRSRNKTRQAKLKNPRRGSRK
jgi:hypothetical protein